MQKSGPAEVDSPAGYALDWTGNITVHHGLIVTALAHDGSCACNGKGCHRLICVEFEIAILYHTILYYTILCYTILYYTILYYTILYYTILYYTRLN